MYNCNTEVIFSDRIIPELGEMRSQAWQELVASVCANHDFNDDRAAFVLLMAQLCGCATCKADSFQALRGCTLCAQRTLRRYPDSDESLLERHRLAKLEVDKFLEINQSSLEQWNTA